MVVVGAQEEVGIILARCSLRSYFLTLKPVVTSVAPQQMVCGGTSCIVAKKALAVNLWKWKELRLNVMACNKERVLDIYLRLVVEKLD
jgi:hypothetical protein